MTRVGFVGLGSQGGPMAQQIIAGGYATTLWARRAVTLEPYAGTGAAFAASPEELAANSDVIGVCVLADRDVDEVVDAMLPGIAPGTVIAVHSTVHPDTCIRVAQLVSERGATLIDAPVSGGGIAAAARALLVMVGGEDEALERCRPVFETFGDPIVHLGPLGTGQLAKLVNNLLFTTQLGTGDAALTLGESLGLDRAALASVLARGSGNSYALGVVAGSGVEPLGAVAGSTLRKDVDIVNAIAAERDVGSGSLAALAEDVLTRMGHPRP
jgi:3-hydroxyisobutyrate dehydrogenase-like beta-hydroxyacid dehydrogenase